MTPKWMPRPARLSGVALAVLVLFSGALAVRAETVTRSLADASLPGASVVLGETVQGVQARFGRPSEVAQEWCCHFLGYQTANRPTPPVVVQAYDVTTGGRMAFVYDRANNSSQWVVVGIVYDVLAGTDYKTIAQFFPHGAPRNKRLITCYEDDFSHTPDGGPSQLSTFAIWSAGSGRTFYAKYLTRGHGPRNYDALSGQDVLGPISELDTLTLVQWGYFQSVSGVMDMHYGQNTDFSIVTAYKKCFR